MQMAELLVSHGASLSARTSLDEMPIGEFTKLKRKRSLRKAFPPKPAGVLTWCFQKH